MPAVHDLLPWHFAAWFVAQGWELRDHQARMLEVADQGRDALLVAPTGGGKTLAGFLPSLVRLAGDRLPMRRLTTLYISPLKALSTDVARNLDRPIRELDLPVTTFVRTGDTPANRRARLQKAPPDILLTTPESLALLLSYPNAAAFFADLETVLLDELHALAESKRGVLLALGMARLRTLAPRARFVGLSATVARPDQLRRFLSPEPERVELILGRAGAPPAISMQLPDGYMPWAGHIALYAVPEIYRLIREARTTLVFVNTRAQAELVFGALWRANREDLPIALHHGSLAVEQRRRVEAAMTKGSLRAVVCTSSLDLGIDWGDVDLVIQVGAPKGAARLLQRIGRANHRLDQPSRAVLIPANRFEVLECQAAIDAVAVMELDGGALAPGGLDVLAQHVTGVACSGAFDADALFAEVRRAAPFAELLRRDFDRVLEFVATGGYALGSYERYRRLSRGPDGLWRLSDGRLARAYRMNVGTIVEAPVMRVRLGLRGRRLGEVEEYFVAMLAPGDTFIFAGRLLRYDGVRDNEVIVSIPKERGDPKVPAYAGGRLPLSSELALRVRAMLSDRQSWGELPGPVREWLEQQEHRSVISAAEELLVESFARGGRHYLVAYCFAGRNAHQTLGMLLTRRMERLGLRPQGFVASDYNVAVWSLLPAGEAEVHRLFDVDILGDDLEEWLAESSLIKRTFRNCAVVAGLIERRHPGVEKTGKQVRFNADLIYDVLRKYEPDHVLLQAARAEAAVGLTDVRRLADLLVSVQGRIRHVQLPRISPFAVSIIAGIGKEFVGDGAIDESLDEVVAELVAEALGEVEPGPETAPPRRRPPPRRVAVSGAQARAAAPR